MVLLETKMFSRYYNTLFLSSSDLCFIMSIVSIVDVYQFMCASFPYCFEGGIRDSIVIVPEHCLFLYFAYLGPVVQN